MRRVLILAIISGFAPFVAFSQSKDHSANGRSLKGAFTAARAMELIYGRYDATEAISDWKPNQAHTYPDDWPDEIGVEVLLDASYVESGVAKHLLVTWARPQIQYEDDKYTCHACGVLTGLVLFAKTSGGWQVEASDLQFGYFGAWGHPPSPISVQPIGPSRYGVTIYTDDEGQGIFDQGIVILSPIGDSFGKIFDSNLAVNLDASECSGKIRADTVDDCVDYDGDVDFVPEPRSDYCDLLLTKRVYRSLSKKYPVGVTVTRYKFDGSKYVPVGPTK